MAVLGPQSPQSVCQVPSLYWFYYSLLCKTEEGLHWHNAYLQQYLNFKRALFQTAKNPLVLIHLAVRCTLYFILKITSIWHPNFLCEYNSLQIVTSFLTHPNSTCLCATESTDPDDCSPTQTNHILLRVWIYITRIKRSQWDPIKREMKLWTNELGHFDVSTTIQGNSLVLHNQ